jgi:membrane protease YdiL (CAAX protease family)
MNARRQSSWPAVHGGIFLAVWGIVALAMPRVGWPWHFLAPFIAYYGLVLIWPALRRTAQRPRVGRLGGMPLLAATQLAALTLAGIAIFQATVDPDVTELAWSIPVNGFTHLTQWAGVSDDSIWGIILAGICFSLFNPVLEELIFRGVLYDAVSAEWGVAVAIGVTSGLFGLVHMHGYPPGPIGAALAGLLGLGLGLIRWWTGGLGLAIACHIVADAIIFCGVFAASGAYAGGWPALAQLH